MQQPLAGPKGFGHVDARGVHLLWRKATSRERIRHRHLEPLRQEAGRFADAIAELDRGAMAFPTCTRSPLCEDSPSAGYVSLDAIYYLPFPRSPEHNDHPIRKGPPFRTALDPAAIPRIPQAAALILGRLWKARRRRNSASFVASPNIGFLPRLCSTSSATAALASRSVRHGGRRETDSIWRL